MLNHPLITVHGNLTADPEVRFTPNRGVTLVEFTVACNPRRFNPETGEWEQPSRTTFWRVKAFRTLGENAADSLRKGNRVTVVGWVQGWESQDSQKSGVEIIADDVAVSLATQIGRFGRAVAAHQSPPDQPQTPVPEQGSNPNESPDAREYASSTSENGTKGRSRKTTTKPDSE